MDELVGEVLQELKLPPKTGYVLSTDAGHGGVAADCWVRNRVEAGPGPDVLVMEVSSGAVEVS